ncbi:MAG: hypothetical protein IJW39_05285 [Opitutales bacterium]|nr:hypothetical protein [Opitutales bacterium]
MGPDRPKASLIPPTDASFFGEAKSGMVPWKKVRRGFIKAGTFFNSRDARKERRDF